MKWCPTFIQSIYQASLTFSPASILLPPYNTSLSVIVPSQTYRILHKVSSSTSYSYVLCQPCAHYASWRLAENSYGASTRARLAGVNVSLKGNILLQIEDLPEKRNNTEVGLDCKNYSFSCMGWLLSIVSSPPNHAVIRKRTPLDILNLSVWSCGELASAASFH